MSVLRQSSLPVCLVAGMLAAACEPPPDTATPVPAATEQRLNVYAVNFPLAWMARTLGDEAVVVTLPVPPGVDPAHWQPPPEVVLDYQAADLVLLNGAGYADWVGTAALSPARVVDTTRGEQTRFVTSGELTHSHGPGGAHTHGDVASHTWLDPTFAAAQARAVARALTRRLPGHAEPIEGRAVELDGAFDALDAELSGAFGAIGTAGVLYSHPVYQYLDKRYGIDGRAVTWEPDTDPGEDEWRQLEAMLRQQPASLMLWEAEPLAEVADRLRRLGVEPVVFDTGALPRDGSDYLGRMKANVDRLRRFAGEGPGDGP